MKPISILLCLFFLISQAQVYSQQSPKKINKKLPGQTAPNDMVFVPGNGDIAPFYISVSEEPNINYIIYLLWLQATFGESYPEVVERALPKSANINTSDQYVDAFVDAYLTNPAYAYYPVTNLTWVQIENYLSWKTDRLNEYILIKNGILNFNTEQKDEDNFNTEAYLTGQYQGSTRKNIILDNPYYLERSVKINDGILFTGFRLPTEKEWDYAAGNTNLKKKRISNKRKVDFHAYGKDYYTLLWGNSLGQGAFDHYDSKLPVGMNSYPLDSDLLMKQNKNPAHFKLARKKDFPSIYDFDPNSYGLINMENGVREWLLNEYQEEVQDTSTNWLMVLQQSGIEINHPDSKDKDGHYLEKDSLGRLRYFRFIDIDANGIPYEIQRYNSNRIAKEKLQRERIQLRRQILKTQRTIAAQEIPKDLGEVAKELAIKRQEMIQQLQKEISEIKDYYALQNTQRIFGQLSQQQAQYNKQFQEQRLETLQKQVKAIDDQIKGLDNQKESTVRQRLVKGGDWKNPGKQRRAMPENEAASNVGFRVILPYTGAPVLKGYKIKWGGRMMKLKF